MLFSDNIIQCHILIILIINFTILIIIIYHIIEVMNKYINQEIN